MSSTLGVLEAAALAAAAFGVLAALAVAAIYPAIRPRLLCIAPTTRARVLLAWLAAPFGGALALTAVCFLPSILSLLGVGPDHCLLHEDGHIHLCLIHRPSVEGGAAGWLTVTLMVTVALGLGHRLREIVRSSRSVSRLLKLATHDRERDLHVVDSDQPVSFATGTLTPAICVSSKVLESIPESLAGVVVEHERAHLRRRDPLRLRLAALLSVGHMPGIRRRLLGDLALACEQACDEAAARCSGDRLDVAQAIVAVERLFPRVLPGLNVAISSFGGGDVAARVEWLLADPAEAPRTGRTVLLVGILAVAVVLNAYHVHHLTETLLGVLLR